MAYSTKRSNRHFLRAMLSRSISSVNHTTVRHGFSIPALCSLATGRWANGLHRNTNSYPPALERVLIAGMRSKPKLLRSPTLRYLGPHCAFKSMKHPSEKQSQEALAGLVERVTYHN